MNGILRTLGYLAFMGYVISTHNAAIPSRRAAISASISRSAEPGLHFKFPLGIDVATDCSR
jgi:hypothetical protein